MPLRNNQRLAVARTIADPVAFSEVYLDETLWEKQVEIMRSVECNPRTAVKACHASSKTRTAASLTLWWLAKFEQAVVITTAPTERQVKKLLWGEIHTLAAKSRIRFPVPSAMELKLGPKRLALGMTTSAENQAVSFAGWHGVNLMIIVDEAPGVDQRVFDAIEGIRTSGNVRVLELGNPVVGSGHFHDNFGANRASCSAISISAFDTPNLKGLTIDDLMGMSEAELDENPCPYLVTRRWVKERYEDWGPEDPRFQARVMGAFPTQGEDALVSLVWLEAASKREAIESAGGIVAGVDVAGPGKDETVVCIVQDGSILDLLAFGHADPRGEVVSVLRGYGERLALVNVDSIGIGYNFARHLQDLGFPVRDINVSLASFDTAEESEATKQYASLKAQLYWNLRERFRKGKVRGLTDETTLAQLSTIRHLTDSRGRIAIEPKEKARRRGVKSPDRAEALMLALATSVMEAAAPQRLIYVYEEDYQVSPY